ncbi:Qat anti-phage system QueC-like protein QatC [Xanthomonas arboricola]|uniref:Qat anti-phage system QueC-like protein QatC n=1 Tax=Xanthomonas arboricola TaxID=56448 RepID=UPI001609AADC|nr:Qat anti-phage system QueC-like protein QatC [Xanthomonas arboricola]MBB4597324.1 7-cyano-7-deazaguanine synthase in queuosine biosynthesis [Xanthomonas arboricola]
MKIFCAPKDCPVPQGRDLEVLLYGQRNRSNDHQGSAGEAVQREIYRAGLLPDQRAWDFLSLALAVVTADVSVTRSDSPDGWTRQIELVVAVSDPGFWSTQSDAIQAMLGFLSTDRWNISFVEGGHTPKAPSKLVRPKEDCVVLLSGGLDSLVGAIDLVKKGYSPMAVSNVVRGDADNQSLFAERIGGGLKRLALNHNATPPWDKEDSQRARSIIFLAFAVVAATTLELYHEGEEVPVFVCENGFIALNPSLTHTRLGSLSTRTAHPEFLNRLRDLLAAAGLRIRLENPYEDKTKGQMLNECKDQALLEELALSSVSCGRYRVFGYQHCGRCVPCQVRRAAINAWEHVDGTGYKFKNLGKKDTDHAKFDDVRSVAMAIAEVKADGIDAWLSSSLSYPRMGDRAPRRALVQRGLAELENLHNELGMT